jgi:transposase
MPKKIFVQPLAEEQEKTLIEAEKYHPASYVRIRAQCILLSNMGLSVKEIAKATGLCRQTVANNLERWEVRGLAGLYDQERSGRPKQLTSEQEAIVLQCVESNPKSLKTVVSELSKKYGIEVSIQMIKRLCKKAGYSWKRMRKSLKNKRNEEEFERSKTLLEELILASKNGEIRLLYFDEAGFSLTPCVPYAWQKKKEHIEIPSARSKNLNVLGAIDRESQLESYVIEGKITSDVVISFFDQMAEKTQYQEIPTIVLIDNAPIHTSNNFDSHTLEWCQKNLIIVPIARYSPELNIIEILWRKIKYEWLPVSAYESFEKFKETLNDILAGVGSEHVIDFS